MQIYVDSYGAYLGVCNGMFHVKPRHSEGRAFAVREVSAILLAKGVSVSSDALLLAIEHAIPVLLLDGLERPAGQVWHGQFGSISTIRKHQALFANDLQGMEWVRQVLVQRGEHQMALLARLQESARLEAPIHDALQWAQEGIAAIRHKLLGWAYQGERAQAIAGTFRGWEGTATRFYFQALSQWLPESYAFAFRSKRPAYDPFNALLNYLYGMLYPMVELALMKAGLDPCTGVLHADEYNRPTMVYDCIELYRHWPEEVALQLCQSQRLPSDAFVETERDGVRLAQSGKGLVVETFLEYMHQKTDYKGVVRKRITHLDLDANRLATMLKNWMPSVLLI